MAVRTRTHHCVPEHCPWPDQSFAAASLAAPFRNMVHLSDRLQSVAQSDDQRNALAQRHAQRGHLYDTFISSSRFTERVDHVGSKVVGKIEQVMAMIGAAAGNASNYSANLANVSQKLDIASDQSACARSWKRWSRPPRRWSGTIRRSRSGSRARRSRTRRSSNI